MPIELVCDLCGKPLRGNPLMHFEEDRASCPAYDKDGKLLQKYAKAYAKTARSISQRS